VNRAFILKFAYELQIISTFKEVNLREND